MARRKLRDNFEHGPTHRSIFLPAATSIFILIWLGILIYQSRETTIIVGSGVPGGKVALRKYPFSSAEPF